MKELRIFLCLLKKLYENKYVAWSELEEAKAHAPKLFADKKFLEKTLRQLFLKDFRTFLKMQKIVREINFYLKNREKLNKKFIKSEQQKLYEIEGNKLDQEQIAAVVACEDAELILASAGSGKSASLLAKVNYIVNDLKIPAEDVLVIAFTRKVVKELKERVKDLNAEICTFHSFGNKIIQENPDYTESPALNLIPENLLEKLVEKILFVWKSSGVLKEAEIKEFTDYETFKKLLISCLQLQKNEQISLSEFKSRISKIKNLSDKEKAEKFYEKYQKVFTAYKTYLKKNHLYDFSDMLSRATKIINSMKENLPYKYILVDEVQDLSLSKSLLLQAILNKCKNAKLFAVGDDWQSIYRFAGSNLGVLKDFEKTFNRKTYRGVIRKTYRFGQPTAWVSEYFIRKNPAQSKKKVITFKKTKTPIIIKISDKKSTNKISTFRPEDIRKPPADYESVNSEIMNLFKEYGEDIFKKRIQVISRYNKDIFRLVDPLQKKYQNAEIAEEKEDGIILKWKISTKTNSRKEIHQKISGKDSSILSKSSNSSGPLFSPKSSNSSNPPFFSSSSDKYLKVAFCSMHKSKGITRDIVFVINLNEGKKGMPSTRSDDPILTTMLATPDKYPLAEERRLFYVAITRATERTILICEKNKVSPFVKEIAKNLGYEEI